MATEASVARTKRRVKAKATAQTTAHKAAANARRQREWRERQAELKAALVAMGVSDPNKAIATLKAKSNAESDAKAAHDKLWSDEAIYADGIRMCRERFGWPEAVTRRYMADESLDPDLVPFDLTQEQADEYRWR